MVKTILRNLDHSSFIGHFIFGHQFWPFWTKNQQKTIKFKKVHKLQNGLAARYQNFLTNKVYFLALFQPFTRLHHEKTKIRYYYFLNVYRYQYKTSLLLSKN